MRSVVSISLPAEMAEYLKHSVKAEGLKSQSELIVQMLKRRQAEEFVDEILEEAKGIKEGRINPIRAKSARDLLK